MSAMRAFFRQRNMELASGASTSDAAIVERLFGPPTSAAPPPSPTLHVAVQGCCHGELDRIYAACAAHERETGRRIDLLICCGDFQSTRDAGDLPSMAVPDKYKTVGDFPRYYSPVGATADTNEVVKAPYLTIFVGGNHENSDWLAEESYGGFLAPNVYYLGHSGVIEVDGALRIGGLSGIFKAVDYSRPYPGQRPYGTSGESGKRSAYHVRRIEVEKLRCYGRVVERIRAARRGESGAAGTAEAPLVDVVVSHDWPAGITKYGNEEQLLRYKPYFREEVAHNALGNPHTLALLRELRPRHWFAAHLHCHFTATVPHTMGSGGTGLSSTAFLALDKCAKGQGFLDFLDIPIAAAAADGAAAAERPAPPDATRYRERVRRDPVWLAVLRHTHTHLAANAVAPAPGGFHAEQTAAAIAAEFLAEGGSGCHGSSGSSSGAVAAPTTAALLSAMGLSPVAPLQVPLGAPRGHGGGGGGGGGGGSRGQGTSVSTQSRAPRGESGSTCVQPPPVAPVAAPPRELEVLGWSEAL